MKIKYILDHMTHSYSLDDPQERTKLSFLLMNTKGDFLNCGVENNSVPQQGFSIVDSKTLDVYKILEDLHLEHLEVDTVTYTGHSVERTYESTLVQSDSETIAKPKDKWYVGPTGGIVYEVENYEGEIVIDLDCRKRDDFDPWGREYRVYEKEGAFLVEYTKLNEDKEEYNLFVALKTPNPQYTSCKQWIEKQYPYAQQRGSLSTWHVFRLLTLHCDSNKKVFIAAGLSEAEALEQLTLLSDHHIELEAYDEQFTTEHTQLDTFEQPPSKDIALAYQLSKGTLFKFMNKNWETQHIEEGCYAGVPWFSDVWTRDELASLKSYLFVGEEAFVHRKIKSYLDVLDVKTGQLPIINKPGSHKSPDGVFWLAKRIEDLLFFLNEKNMLFKSLSRDELEGYYTTLSLAFNRLIKTSWDQEQELLKGEYAQSWMDTIHVEYPLGLQMQLLSFISSMGVLAGVLNKKNDVEKFLDLEDGMRHKLRNAYLRNGTLYNEPNKDVLNCNVFLGYYMYKELLLAEDWEKVFDEALKKLRTHWGGMRSLAYDDPEYQDNYTGENNLSYHRGDSWYWINCIAALALNDVNEKKYRKVIHELLQSTAKDVLSLGTIGFSSEISSASNQRAEGCLAQLWSSAFFVEAVQTIFKAEK